MSYVTSIVLYCPFPVPNFLTFSLSSGVIPNSSSVKPFCLSFPCFKASLKLKSVVRYKAITSIVVPGTFVRLYLGTKAFLSFFAADVVLAYLSPYAFLIFVSLLMAEFNYTIKSSSGVSLSCFNAAYLFSIFCLKEPSS